MTITPRRASGTDWVNDRFGLYVFDIEVKLVDALGFDPQWDGGPPTLEKPITNTVNSSFNRVGSLTDGASLVVIQLKRLGMSGVDTDTAHGQLDFEGYKLTIKDPNWPEAGAKELGSLWSGDKDNLPPLPTTISAPGETTLVLEEGELAVFYRAPLIWAFGQQVKERTIRIEVRGPCDDENVPPIKEYDFTLHKPPLLLVHGIFSGPETWSSLVSGLSSQNAVMDILPVNFRQEYATKGIDRSAAIIADTIRSHIHELRDENIAVTRLDCVAHSYGGLSTRWWMHAASNSMPRKPSLGRVFQIYDMIEPLDEGRRYLQPDNYGVGSLRAFITIGTPHYGSWWATLIAAVLNQVEAGDERVLDIEELWLAFGAPNIDGASDMSHFSTVANHLLDDGLSSPKPAQTRFLASYAGDSDAPPSTFNAFERALLLFGMLDPSDSDLIVSVNSQRNNPYPNPGVHFQAVHWEQTSSGNLLQLVVDSIHSQTLNEFGPNSFGPGD